MMFAFGKAVQALGKWQDTDEICLSDFIFIAVASKQSWHGFFYYFPNTSKCQQIVCVYREAIID